MPWIKPVLRAFSRPSRRRRRSTAVLLLAAFSLGLAHGWLHLSDGDGRNKGHFAKAANEFCLAEKLAAAVPPPVLQTPECQPVPLVYAFVSGRETGGRPASVGYFPRDPPTA